MYSAPSGCGVLYYPFARLGNYGLTGGYVEHAFLMSYAERAFEHDCGYHRTRASGRVRTQPDGLRILRAMLQPRLGGVHVADEFIDEFRFIPRGGDAGRSWNQFWHKVSLSSWRGSFNFQHIPVANQIDCRAQLITGFH